MLSDARAEAAVPVGRLGPARRFYEDVLGLRAVEEHTPGVDVTFECGNGTRLMLYEWAGTLTKPHTVAHFVVDDVPATVAQLRERGVRFDEYDLPGTDLVDGIATIGAHRYAWFKDRDLNVLAVHD